ncbi:MAG: hypothetical protein RMM29_00875 [Planctomycetota bacterium]|nr:hypothetical protein [Planctomycetota bacterium]MCX8040568.1 hypothetical protein [Planctomycetota bacterium]MDW8372188.1 hypothetical protein [Planctomycetota bacterium]
MLSTIRSVCVTCILLAAHAGPLAAGDDGTWDYWVRVQASAAYLTLAGETSYTARGVPGTAVEVSDLGLDSGAVAPGLELGLTTPLLSFHGFLAGSQWTLEETTTLGSAVQFGGRSFAASTQVRSELTISDAYAEICWGPIELDIAGFAVGLAVHRLGLQATLSGGGQSASFDEVAYLPTLALRAYVAPIDMLEAEAMVHGLSVPLGEVASATFASAQAQLSFYPIDFIGAFVGYRYTLAEVEFEYRSTAIDASLTLSGPFAGIAAQF